MRGTKKWVRFLSIFLVIFIGIQSLGVIAFADSSSSNNHVKMKQIIASKSGSSTFALMENDTVMAWGYNGDGRLGIGNTDLQYSPVTVPGLTDVDDMIAGTDCAYALMEDGTVKAWGNNNYGQLGIGNTTNQLSPVTIAGLTGVHLIAAGDKFAFALMNDGTVKAWGYNNYGQLGLGDTANRTSPVSISNLTGVDQIVTGTNCAYAVIDDGTVKAWGINGYGQLGIGNTTTQISPVSLSSLTGVNQIITGDNYVFALMNNSTVKAWGYNNYGQLGVGNTQTQTLPVDISGLGDVKQIVTGSYCAYALLNDGTVRSWGGNGFFQLGNGDTTTQTSPVAIPSLSQVNQLIAGFYGAFAIKNNGTVAAWGYSIGYQLGLGDTVLQQSPAIIPDLAGVNHIAVANASVYAVLNDGSVKVWGDNGFGQLGIGRISDISTFFSQNSLYGTKKIVTGSQSAYALFWDGTVKAWGNNQYGQLGIGNETAQYTPITISNLNNVESLSSYPGSNTVYAVLRDGTVKAWGENTYGELGIGNTTNHNSPVTVNNLSDVKEVVAGNHCAFALLNDGTVKAWGLNNYGQLGIGNTQNQSTPVIISGLTDVRKIAVADSGQTRSVYALLDHDGVLVAWGYNGNGELGIGNTVSSSTPVCTSVNYAVDVVAGNGFAFAIDASGYHTTIMAWGSNYQGVLGTGNPSPQYYPVDIGLFYVGSIMVSGTSVYALAEGCIYSWGNNTYGQLGVGDASNKTIPTQVSNFYNVSQLVAKDDYAYAINWDGIKSWGRGKSALGIGDQYSSTETTPVTVPGLDYVDEVVLGNGTVYAISSDEMVSVCGSNENGALGLGYNNKVKVPTNLVYFEAVAQDTWGATNTVTVTDSSIIPTSYQKWAIGDHTKDYFSNHGTFFSGDQFTVNQNGVYTVYERKISGEELVQKVTVNHVLTTQAIGNYTESFTDLTGSSVGSGVTIERNYDSAQTETGVLGKGWSFSYSGRVQNSKYTYLNDSGVQTTGELPTLKVVTLFGQSLQFVWDNGIYTSYDSHATLALNENGTFTLTDADQVQYHFNTDGYLASIADVYGNTTTITLGTGGQVQSVLSTAGQSYAIGYTNGKITSITDPAGRAVTYSYTGDLLTGATNPMGQTTTYAYTNTRLTQVADPLGNTKEAIAYSSAGQVTSVTDSAGETVTYHADPVVALIYIATDSSGNETRYNHDATGRLQSVQTETGTTTYNQYGETLTAADQTVYQYNARGDVTSAVYSNSTSELYSYDENGFLVTYTDRNGMKTFYQNDAYGNALLVAKQKDGTTIDYTAGCNQSLFTINQYTYYSDGMLETATDPEGAVTTYTYDSHGNQLTAETVKGGVTTETTVNTYNAIGWNLSAVVTNSVGTTSVTNVYDLNGTVVRTKDQDGTYTRYVYDAAGRLLQKISADRYRSAQDGLNSTPVSYQYSNPMVGERYVYNQYGGVLRYTNTQGKVTRYVYDSNRRLAQKIGSDQYDAADDGLYNITPVDTYLNPSAGYRYTYNSFGALAREIAPNGDTTRYLYDANKKLIQQINPQQYVAADDGLNASTPTDTYASSSVGFRYTYGSGDQLLREIAPDGGVTRYVYNASQQLIQKIGPDQYVAFCDGLNASMPADTYSNNTVGYRYTYYDDGTTKTVKKPDGTEFYYDRSGNLTKAAYSQVREHEYRYDPNGKLVFATNTDDWYLNYEYDTAGNVVNFGMGVANEQNTYAYTYDVDGNIVSTIRTIHSDHPALNNAETENYYTYDGNDQLVREDNGVLGETICYSYDESGNITVKKVYDYTRQEDLSSIPAVYTQTYTYGNSGDPDQLTGCGGQSLSYDNEGNLTAYNGWTYSWSNGNLTGATNSGLGNTASYTYRYDGIRTGKTVNGVTTTYTLDGNTIVGETDGTNTIQYIYDENNNPVYMVYNGVKLFYERNLQGDITGIIDFGHTRLVTYSYDTWGNLTQIGGPEAGTLGLANSLRYRGYYYDTETGLYYLQSRYYDPGLGRFISKDDPIFHEGDTGVAANLYVYCENNPVINVELWGYIKINIRWLGTTIDLIIFLIPTLFAISKVWSTVSKSANKLVSFGNELIAVGKSLFKRFDDRLYCAFAKESTYRVVRTIGILAGIGTIVSSIGNTIQYIIDILDGKWDGYLDTNHFGPKLDFTRDY